MRIHAGVPYLSGMDERIATPRLSTPRTKINAVGGNVAAQTGYTQSKVLGDGSL